MLALADAPAGSPHIVIMKSQRILEFHSSASPIKSFRIGLGLNPVPPKRQQGDRATPEGEYFVCGKNPHSTYFMALVLSYPNEQDAQRGLNTGLITKAQYSQIVSALKKKQCPPFNTALGGEVEIHGMGSQTDWTWGCVALDSADVKEVYSMIPIGTPVLIKP